MTKIISALISVFLTLPIWFYLLYRILETVQASELMWFLYWIYLPAALFAATLAQLAEKK